MPTLLSLVCAAILARSARSIFAPSEIRSLMAPHFPRLNTRCVSVRIQPVLRELQDAHILEAVNGTQSKNRPYRILNLERLREFATNPAAQFFREVESPEGGDRSEPPAAVALDQAIEAPGALFEDFPKTILPLEAPSGSILFDLKEKLAQTERLLVAMTEQQDRDTADFEARLANVEGTLRSIKVIFSERLF